MAGRDGKTIGCRVTENLKNRFERESRLRDMTLANVVEAFVIASENDDIDFIDKTFISKEPETNYKNRIDKCHDRFVDILTEKGYPENAISDMMENILNNAMEMGKYNSKRSRFSDTGC